MEHSIKLIDFETVDQMVQVHGACGLPLSFIPKFQLNGPDMWTVDYEGVSLSSRTANSKAAASELSSIFQSHYPEFLVRHCLCTSPFPQLGSNFHLPS